MTRTNSVLRSFCIPMFMLVGGTCVLAGCDAGEDVDDESFLAPGGKADGPRSLSDDSPEAIAILAVANQMTEDEFLDAGMTGKTAALLLQHRSGPDGMAGTADDVMFTSLAELDAVPGTGLGFINIVFRIAEENGFVNCGLGTCSAIRIWTFGPGEVIPPTVARDGQIFVPVRKSSRIHSKALVFDKTKLGPKDLAWLDSADGDISAVWPDGDRVLALPTFPRDTADPLRRGPTSLGPVRLSKRLDDQDKQLGTELHGEGIALVADASDIYFSTLPTSWSFKPGQRVDGLFRLPRDGGDLERLTNHPDSNSAGTWSRLIIDEESVYGIRFGRSRTRGAAATVVRVDKQTGDLTSLFSAQDDEETEGSRFRTGAIEDIGQNLEFLAATTSAGAVVLIDKETNDVTTLADYGRRVSGVALSSTHAFVTVPDETLAEASGFVDAIHLQTGDVVRVADGFRYPISPAVDSGTLFFQDHLAGTIHTNVYRLRIVD